MLPHFDPHSNPIECVRKMILHCLSIHLPNERYFHCIQDLAIMKTNAAAKSLQLCLTLCNPIDSSPPGSPIPGILQGRILEWVAISFSNAWKWKVKVKSLSHVWLFATPWTTAHQAPPSVGFPRQEYWSGVPLPSLAIMKKVAINKKKKRHGFYWWAPTLKLADFPKASRLSPSCLAPPCVLLGRWVSASGFVLSLWLPPTAIHATQGYSDS